MLLVGHKPLCGLESCWLWLRSPQGLLFHRQTPNKQGSVASGLEGYIRTTLHCMASRFVLSQHRDL